MTRKHRTTTADQARTKQADAIFALAEHVGMVFLDWQKTHIAANLPIEQPETVAVRMLAVEHLGRWITLPGRPERTPRVSTVEPSIETPAGRLVGIRITEEAKRPRGLGGAPVPTRTLVLQQGAQMIALVYAVDHPVVVAPRSWS